MKKTVIAGLAGLLAFCIMMKKTVIAGLLALIIIAFILLNEYKKSEIKVVVVRVVQDSITYVLVPVRLADGNLKPLVAKLWYDISTKDSLDRATSLTWLKSYAGGIIRTEAAKVNIMDIDSNINELVTKCNQVLISNFGYAVDAMKESERPAAVPTIRIKSLEVPEALTVVERDQDDSKN